MANKSGKPPGSEVKDEQEDAAIELTAGLGEKPSEVFVAGKKVKTKPGTATMKTETPGIASVPISPTPPAPPESKDAAGKKTLEPGEKEKKEKREGQGRPGFDSKLPASPIEFFQKWLKDFLDWISGNIFEPLIKKAYDKYKARKKKTGSGDEGGGETPALTKTSDEARDEDKPDEPGAGAGVELSGRASKVAKSLATPEGVGGGNPFITPSIISHEANEDDDAEEANEDVGEKEDLDNKENPKVGEEESLSPPSKNNKFNPFYEPKPRDKPPGPSGG